MQRFLSCLTKTPTWLHCLPSPCSSDSFSFLFLLPLLLFLLHLLLFPLPTPPRPALYPFPHRCLGVLRTGLHATALVKPIWDQLCLISDRVTIRNSLQPPTDISLWQMGHGYFIFSLFCLAFMLTNREKKERKDFLEAGRCLLCFSRCLQGTRIPSTSWREDHTAWGEPAASLASLGANQAVRLTKKRHKSDIPLVSKAPKVIFTNKIFDDARRNNWKNKTENHTFFHKQIEIQSSSYDCFYNRVFWWLYLMLMWTH